jgi:hypothetical protein
MYERRILRRASVEGGRGVVVEGDRKGEKRKMKEDKDWRGYFRYFLGRFCT